jgi:hypothetical protein
MRRRTLSASVPGEHLPIEPINVAYEAIESEARECRFASALSEPP